MWEISTALYLINSHSGVRSPRRPTWHDALATNVWSLRYGCARRMHGLCICMRFSQ